MGVGGGGEGQICRCEFKPILYRSMSQLIATQPSPDCLGMGGIFPMNCLSPVVKCMSLLYFLSRS